MDEPCTNRIRPAGPEGSPAYFSNRNRRTSPFCAQCSSPRIATAGVTGLFMLGLRTVVGNTLPRGAILSEIDPLTNECDPRFPVSRRGSLQHAPTVFIGKIRVR